MSKIMIQIEGSGLRKVPFLTISDFGACGYSINAWEIKCSSVILCKATPTEAARSMTSFIRLSFDSKFLDVETSANRVSWGCLILLTIFTASNKDPPQYTAILNAAITRGSLGWSANALWNAKIATLKIDAHRWCQENIWSIFHLSRETEIRILLTSATQICKLVKLAPTNFMPYRRYNRT